MKLNYKRTLLVGFAFLSISALWQMYDNVVPLILKNAFGVTEGDVGIVMSIDNILAIFMLPLFGALSDKLGRRIPFIVGGTILAAIAVLALSFLEKSGSLIAFMAGLGALLMFMAIYRSPAVALMPDITPKPLRSKANAVINLMGTVGGLFTLVATMFLVKTPADGSNADHTKLFIAVAILMLVAVGVLVLTIREKKLVNEMRDINYGVDPEAESAELTSAEPGSEKLPREVKRSLILILASIFFWFMGYNGVTTFFTTYAEKLWSVGVETSSVYLTIAIVGAFIAFIPIGQLASKIGRKKTIMIGIALLTACFVVGALAADNLSPALYLMFVLVGAAWAAINVNSYPMVVEISRYGSIGKYTGYYYLASSAAMVITANISGRLLENIGYHALFPYAAIMVACSFVTMLFVHHGDSKPVKPASKLEAFDTPDGD